MKKRYFLGYLACIVSLFFSTSYSWYTLTPTDNGLQLNMMYGATLIHEAIIVKLIAHPAFQRLQLLHQYGVMRYMEKCPLYSYTRYEHSLGVFLILRLFGAPLEEQIAGLLHDISHTAFSHVGDLVFNRSMVTKSHQDTIYTWYLHLVGLDTLLTACGFDRVCTYDKEIWPALSQPAMHVCADRIEYNVQGALLENMINEADGAMLMRDVRYDNEQWYFVTIESARLFGYISLALTEHIWSADWNLFIYHYAAHALRRALDIGLITAHDMYVATDDIIWNILSASNDPIIQDALDCVKKAEKRYVLGDEHAYDFYEANRFRGVDPLVMINGTLHTLSELDAVFCTEFQRVYAFTQKGHYFTLLPKSSIMNH